jgi:hypothetical protein
VEWFTKKHYAHRIPSVSYAFGLYQHTSLIGVCSFGRPLSSTLVSGAINGLYQETFLELNRLVINENVAKNTLSFFVGRCLRMLPKPNVVVSYADTSYGHHGYIYQATNWLYTGLSAKAINYVIKGQEHLHTMTVTDKLGRTDTHGSLPQVQLLQQKYGDDLYTVARPRKHRYFYFIGSKKQQKEMVANLSYPIQPYPKGDNHRYDASHQPSTQGRLI